MPSRTCYSPQVHGRRGPLCFPLTFSCKFCRRHQRKRTYPEEARGCEWHRSALRRRTAPQRLRGSPLWVPLREPPPRPPREPMANDGLPAGTRRPSWLPRSGTRWQGRAPSRRISGLAQLGPGRVSPSSLLPCRCSPPRNLPRVILHLRVCLQIRRPGRQHPCGRLAQSGYGHVTYDAGKSVQVTL